MLNRIFQFNKIDHREYIEYNNNSSSLFNQLFINKRGKNNEFDDHFIFESNIISFGLKYKFISKTFIDKLSLWRCSFSLNGNIESKKIDFALIEKGPALYRLIKKKQIISIENQESDLCIKNKNYRSKINYFSDLQKNFIIQTFNFLIDNDIIYLNLISRFILSGFESTLNSFLFQELQIHIKDDLTSFHEDYSISNNFLWKKFLMRFYYPTKVMIEPSFSLMSTHFLKKWNIDFQDNNWDDSVEVVKNYSHNIFLKEQMSYVELLKENCSDRLMYNVILLETLNLNWNSFFTLQFKFRLGYLCWIFRIYCNLFTFSIILNSSQILYDPGKEY